MSDGRFSRFLDLTDRICAAVHEVEPTSRVILYGSRARGDAAPDSDWDLLILVDGPVTREREEALTDRLFNLGLETDTVLSSLVHSKEEWASPIYQAVPFHENVTREGIPI
ncbi:MAG: nucleotidyltransferase domain-containing protein [Chloroflexi bacterium]|nr:nucleotidyltransferase domain-containing protein [Chloroflexota bacterium]